MNAKNKMEATIYIDLDASVWNFHRYPALD